jgi:hypothetical protein
VKDPDHRYTGIPLNLNDRRTTERFDLPDAHIELILHGSSHRNIKLIDITFNSIRVITSLVVKEEQDLLIKIKIPYKQPLSLKGFVLRLDEVYNKKDKFMVTIKFHPFSTYERYNALEDRKALKDILDRGVKL